MIQMAQYAIALLFIGFCSVLTGQAIQIHFERQRKKKRIFEARTRLSQTIENKHQHDWRRVTEFAKQCREVGCKIIGIESNAPDGMPEYLQLLAKSKSREESITLSEEYKSHDPRMDGWRCPKCNRVIPSLNDLPRSPWKDRPYELNPLSAQPESKCPYCQVDLVKTSLMSR